MTRRAITGWKSSTYDVFLLQLFHTGEPDQLRRIILDDERTPLDSDLRRRRKLAAAVATGIDLEVNDRKGIANFGLRTRNASTQEQQWLVGDDTDQPALVRWKLDGDARWCSSAVGELHGLERALASIKRTVERSSPGS
jgi:hypothetical protein